MLVIGLTLLGVGVAIVRSVDDRLATGRDALRPAVGPPEPETKSLLDAEGATRFTMLGVVVAVLGAGNVMIGSLLLTLTMIEKHAMKSALGTDPT